MLRFVIRKMISKKWMLLALLIGNILSVSIASANPMYTRAMLQRTLTRGLEDYLTENNAYPGLITLTMANATKSLETIKAQDAWALQMEEKYQVPAIEKVCYRFTQSVRGALEMNRSDAQEPMLSIASLNEMEEHITLLTGRMYSQAPDAEGIIDVIVSEGAMRGMNLMMEDVIEFPRLLDSAGNSVKIRIAGMFTNKSQEDIYWVRNPNYYYDECFMDPDLFNSLFMNQDTMQNSISTTWYVLLDYTQFRGENAQAMLAASEYLTGELNSQFRKNYRDNFTDVLSNFVKTEKKVNVTLWVLQTPVFALLAAFVFMVSRQMLEMEQNEIAVIKSRGAGRGQIFSIYFIQSLLVALLSYGAGIPLGAYLCQVIGASNAFLEFVNRGSLPVEVHKEALLFAGAASLLSMAAMVIPALRYSKASIVGHKRQKNKKITQTPMWQKLCLDFIILGVALYGLYSFSGQKDILAVRVLEGASLDPLLFLSSSLFMIGAGLLAVRVLPLVVWVLFRLFRRIWSPALYASFMRVLRTRSSQGFIMVFLIMTIALGVFNAQAARTINQNAEDNLRYAIGADLVVQEKWADNASSVADDPNLEMEYYEPDFGRYDDLEGAQAIARVYVNKDISVSVSKGTVKNVQLMGIHTKDFGEAAWFKDSLSDIHWYHYLNALSRNSRSVLLSRNFQTTHGYKLGDTITYRNKNGDSQMGIVYGFVDYFPGFLPVEYKQGTDGVFKETENYLIVAHLQQLQSSWGEEPYQLWIKNKDGSGYFYEFAQENGIGYTLFQDSDAKLTEKKNDPVLQGTNGILTVGFIVVLLLCSVGFLIYWILSIRSRSLQFGIFRAMGMSMREVITMLLNEQLFISALPLGVGAAVGHFTAKLYMPLIQLAYAASDYAIPLEVVSHTADYVRLFVIIGIVILLCMVVLGMLISRLKIAQALKLGED
ncbi:MAG: FtsX-like permease family protein [Clostridiales bacterium]|nr:FtsX-like permease family protein [Clostridiales bacterium]